MTDVITHLCRCALKRLLIQINQQDFGAFLGEPLRSSDANAARTTSNDRYFPC